MTSNLELLKQNTKLVADTGNLDAIKQCRPLDTTTNPSILLQVANQEQYQHFLLAAINSCQTTDGMQNIATIKLQFTTLIGNEILQFITGRLSVEVDAALSFDTLGTISKAHEIINSFANKGVDKNRILIKIAATWEGILAGAELQKQGINCNLTLIFCLAQAIKCADLGIKLISPFVGRITDWHRNKQMVNGFTPTEDPGVQSLQEIYNYLKKFDYATEVMGASFRNIGQIKALNGCDLLTISPSLMEELQHDKTTMHDMLTVANAKQSSHTKVDLHESEFRWQLNQNQMATEKLAEGIRNFHQADLSLEDKIKQIIKQPK